MNKILTRIAAVAALTAFVCGGAIAKPPAHKVVHHAVKKSVHVKCPTCGMFLASHKTAKMPVEIKYHGKTYYCCHCKMPASMIVHPGKKSMHGMKMHGKMMHGMKMHGKK